MNNKRIFFWLALIMFASVLVRLPLINRPLASGHEWITAHSLMTLQAWSDKGMAAFNYGPVINYTQPGDVGIPWYGYTLLEDARGNIYHASYPPLAYYVPYALFKLLGVRPDTGPLEWFNLGLSLVSGGLVFMTVYRLYQRRGSPHAGILGLCAAAVYLFAPAVLWFETNTYFVDMGLQPLFVASLFLTMEVLAVESPGRGLLTAWVGVYFLMAYTEWLAGPFLLVLAILIWRRGELRRRRGALIWLALAGLLAVVLVTVHYASLAGYGKTLALFGDKLREKSGYSEEAKFTWKKLVWMFRDDGMEFCGSSVLLAFEYAVWWGVGRSRPRERLDHSEAALLGLAFWPLVLHFLLLMGFWLGHNYNSLKLAPLVAFATALGMERVLRFLAGNQFRQRACYGVVLFSLGLSVAGYYWQTKPWRHDMSLRDLGRSIAQMSKPDEFISMKTPFHVVVPQIMYYAQRSILYYEDDAQLARHAQRYGVANCLWLEVDASYHIVRSRNLFFSTEKTGK